MPKIKTGDIETYYEIYGKGRAILFIHGAWCDLGMWKSQIEDFSENHSVLIYDVRGHGKTGISELNKYTIELFADDLKKLIDNLDIDKPIICGLSMGGMIAQNYAVKYPDALSGLILSDTAISTQLTFFDKIVRYVLAPKWMFLGFVRLMGVDRYSEFAFWFAKKSRGENWIKNPEFIEYEKERMKEFTVKEFNKIFSALYDFKLLELSKINVPTLLINGEYESKSVFKHTEKAKELISNSYDVIIKQAGHASNVENPEEFNNVVKEFLSKNNL